MIEPSSETGYNPFSSKIETSTPPITPKKISDRTTVALRQKPNQRLDAVSHLDNIVTPLKQKLDMLGALMQLNMQDKPTPSTAEDTSITQSPLFFLRKRNRAGSFSEEMLSQPTIEYLLRNKGVHTRSRGDIPLEVSTELANTLVDKMSNKRYRSSSDSEFSWRFNQEQNFHLIVAQYDESDRRWFCDDQRVIFHEYGIPTLMNNENSYIAVEEVLTVVTAGDQRYKCWVLQSREPTANESYAAIEKMQQHLFNTPEENIDSTEMVMCVKRRDVMHRAENKMRKPSAKSLHKQHTPHELLNQQLELLAQDNPILKEMLEQFDFEVARWNPSFQNTDSAEYVHYSGRALMPVSPTRTAYRRNGTKGECITSLSKENGREVINSQFAENFGIAFRGHNTFQLIMETLIRHMVDYRGQQSLERGEYDRGLEMIVRVKSIKGTKIPLQVIVGFIDPVTKCFVYQHNCQPLRTTKPYDVRKATVEWLTEFLQERERSRKTPRLT